MHKSFFETFPSISEKRSRIQKQSVMGYAYGNLDFSDG